MANSMFLKELFRFSKLSCKLVGELRAEYVKQHPPLPTVNCDPDGYSEGYGPDEESNGAFCGLRF
jgi:hypothetical protein